MEEELEEEGLVVRGRVVIDTRQPFRSVKEAVALFGKTVLVQEIYGNKLKQQVELYKTSEMALKRPKEEEGNIMAYCFTSLEQELHRPNTELQQFNSRQFRKQQEIDDDDVKIKEPENVAEIDVLEPPIDDFEKKKRHVKFGNSNPMHKEINVKKKSKRKFLNIPSSIGGIFSKKKVSQQGKDVNRIVSITC